MHPPSAAFFGRGWMCLLGAFLAVGAMCLAAVTQPLQAEPLDRRAAEWVLLMGGSVGLSGQTSRIRDVTGLPEEEFQLELVELVAANILPRDLQYLVGLKHLKRLNLNGTMWNPSCCMGDHDESSLLGIIASSTTLEELTFSYSFLASIKFNDDGLKEIAPLTNLKVLSLENTIGSANSFSPTPAVFAAVRSPPRFNAFRPAPCSLPIPQTRSLDPLFFLPNRLAPENNFL